ncbi:pimeloyl-ACP methyl ester carboxylesterase [Streptomyces atratus]
MGGHAAILAAARHPELIRALVAIEADVSGPDPTPNGRLISAGGSTRGRPPSAHEWQRITCPTLLILARSSFISPSRVDDLRGRLNWLNR